MRADHKGILYAFLAYVTWGAFPLFWKMIDYVDSYEVLASRIIWSFVFTFIIVIMFGQRKELAGDLRYLWFHKKQLAQLIAASFFISVNWFLYIWSVANDRLIETSLGYYINPLISVLFGVLFFKEKLSMLQKLSTVIAFVAVLLLTFNYGTIPWLAICIAVSFAIYGVVKKSVALHAIRGLTIETLIILPFALIYYVMIWTKGQVTFLHTDWLTSVMLMMGGVVTAVPLILFANGAKSIPLYMIGFLQYITPTTLLLFGVFVYKEPFRSDDLFAFSLIWVALLLFSFSKLWEMKKSNT